MFYGRCLKITKCFLKKLWADFSAFKPRFFGIFEVKGTPTHGNVWVNKQKLRFERGSNLDPANRTLLTVPANLCGFYGFFSVSLSICFLNKLQADFSLFKPRFLSNFKVFGTPSHMAASG